MTEQSGIEAYPVGLLWDIKRRRVGRSLRGYLWPLIKKRKWRSVRSYFNGYLAEWHYPPEGMKHYRAGRGWTRRAAIRRLAQHIAESNMYKNGK